MDGLKVRFSGDIYPKYFERDKYGMSIPKTGALNFKALREGVRRQLRSKTGLSRAMIDSYRRTDVEFTDNPDGNSPVIGYGRVAWGSRPWTKLKRKGEIFSQGTPDPSIVQKLHKRSEALKRYSQEVVDLWKSMEPRSESLRDHLLWEVEGDQALTGGGFDNNKAYEVHKSAMNFVSKASNLPDRKDSVLSRHSVEGYLWLRDHIEAAGLRKGSLRPMGATKVRVEQEKDGMLGYPVYSKSMNPLTTSIATRLLIEYGVDTRKFVGTSVVDDTTGVTYEYRIIDAIAHILDNSIFSPEKLQSVVTLLARIQKTGYTVEDGKLVKKNGKTRSVYPNAAIPSVIEAMFAQPFLNALQELKVSFMPSLQTKEVRVEMLGEILSTWWSKGLEGLAADWTQYDATINGADLATFIDIVVKYFYHADYHQGWDFVNYMINFKYILFRKDYCVANLDNYNDMMSVIGENYIEEDGWLLVGITHGLISGLKLTHVGGSAVGEVAIHYVIPKILGYEPEIGPQAGDDTIMAYPRDRVDYGSAENTYRPIQEAASQLGLEMNLGKQIFHQAESELIKVFLQENYHTQLEINGVGTAFRPLSAIFVSERDKGLSIAEQLLAQISKMNQGHDSPFIDKAVEFWLSKEEFIGVLFKEHGRSAFNIIVDSIGKTPEELAERVDVNFWSWGLSPENLASGNIPILDVIAEVSQRMTYSVSASEAAKRMRVDGFNRSGAPEEEAIDEIDSGFDLDNE